MTNPLGNSQRSRLKLQVHSLIFLSWVFLPTKKHILHSHVWTIWSEFYCKSASTPRLKCKTIALQYLGQISSKLAPKTLVRKLVFPPSLDLVIFFYQRLLFDHKRLCVWPLKLSEHYEPGYHIKNQQLKPLRHSRNVSHTKFDVRDFWTCLIFSGIRGSWDYHDYPFDKYLLWIFDKHVTK